MNGKEFGKIQKDRVQNEKMGWQNKKSGKRRDKEICVNYAPSQVFNADVILPTD